MPIALAVLAACSTLAACTGLPGTGVAPGGPTASAGGVTVSAEPGAFADGATVSVTPAQAPGPVPELLAGPSVRIAASTGEQPRGPVEIRFPAPADGAPAHIAYFDEPSGRWFPVETRTDPGSGELVATTDHFSWWSTVRDTIVAGAAGAPAGVQNAASWLEYQSGRILGARGTRPSCSGGMPDWVAGELITNPDDNAELFACGQTRGARLEIRVVNNRGYPVTLEVSAPYRKVDSRNLPADLGDVVSRVANPSTPTRVFLPAKGSASVLFDRPSGVGGVVSGHVRRDAGTLLTAAAFELASIAGADLPVGGGKTFGTATVECAAQVWSAAGGVDEGVRDTNAGRIYGEILDLRKCADNVVEGELRNPARNPYTLPRLESAKKFLKAVQWFGLEQKVLDAFVNDATREAGLVDVSFRWRGPSDGAGDLGRFVDEWSRHSTTYVIRADGTGEVHERTYTSCGTSPDCAYDAVLSVRPTEGGAIVTYTRVGFSDSDGRPMDVTAAEHADLDRYFPLAGDRMSAVVDDGGRLVLTPLGDAAGRLDRTPDANTYCGKATAPDRTFECGA